MQDLENMAAEEQKTLHEYATPLVTDIQSSIRRPAIEASSFEIQPSMIQMIHCSVQFGGYPNDDPNEHLINFLEICDTYKYEGVFEDAFKLRLFPFTLCGKAKSWLHSLPASSISTWNDLVKKFLAKFFPQVKIAKLRSDITAFVQLDSESLYEAWERFKELLRKCPHHGIPMWLQIQTFYNGLNVTMRTNIDVVAGGSLMEKNYDDAYELLEIMANNNYQWSTTSNTRIGTVGVNQNDIISALVEQVAAIARKLDSGGYQSMQKDVLSCDICAGNHAKDQCAIKVESVQFIEGSNYQSNHNLNVDDHVQKKKQIQEQQAFQQEQKSMMEDLLSKF